MRVLCLGVLLACFFEIGLAQAQIGLTSPTGISATATESVPVKAQRLRLIMLIKAKGADPKAAVIALTEHKQRVQKELESMKADKESIEFSPSRLMAADSNDAARMQMQMQMQMSNAGAAPGKTLPTVHTAACALKAEWPLPGGEGDALALLPATLGEQIKTRDLAGDNNKPKLTKEVQEQLDELEGMTNERYSYQNTNEQTSKILFIGLVPEDAKQKATAAAFAKATKEADLLANSTGQKRGKLLSLSTDNARSQYDQLVRTAYGGFGVDASPASILSKFEADDSSVTSPNADDLALTISVNVVYAIE